MLSKSISLVLLMLVPLGASAQAQQDFLKTYVGQSFLLRQHGGWDETLKIKKENVARYKGSCDQAMQVTGAKLAKGTLEFTVVVIGSVGTIDGKPVCTESPAPQTKKVSISGFSVQEAESDLEAAVGQVLLTPEQYLASYGLSVSPPVDTPEVPLSKAIPAGGTKPRLLLGVDPDYPAGARLAGVGGKVAIGLIIGRDGQIHEPTISTGAGTPFEAYMLSVLSLWRYEPVRLDGQTIAIRTTVTITFFLKP